MDEQTIKNENQFYPKPIPYDNYQKINDQVKRSICKIKINNSKEGLGFFCKIPFPDKNSLLPVLITSSNIISNDSLEKEKEKIRIVIENKNIDINLSNRIKYINKIYNITIIDVKDMNTYDFINYFELDDKIIENILNANKETNYFMEEMYIIHNIGDKTFISFGKIENNENNQNLFNFYCNTNQLELNMLPILNLNNNKLIGVHKENSTNNNIGLFLNETIREFIEIKYYIANALNKFNLSEKKEIIGKGGFGVVYLIEYNKKEYALKKIPLINFDKDEMENYEKEANILSNLNNEYIVKYYGSFKEKDYYNILMEYAGNSNLKKLIKEYKQKGQLLEEDLINNIIFQICEGLKYIHQSSIIHRDLKPENIFINENKKIIIGDFGISKMLETNRKYANSQIGSFKYMAPEMIKKEKYNYKVDIYALGCIIYELFTTNEYYTDKVIEEKDGKINLNIYNKKWQELINSLLKKDYHQRPDINDIYKYLNKNEIILTLKINKEDVYKNIYFIDNSNNHDIFEEMNELNTKIYINNNNSKYKKFFIPKKEGIYTIKLLMNFSLTSTSYMFYNCKNLIEIDLSSLNTSQVTKMNEMFYGCYNLKNINLSPFNTKKVKNMDSMFCHCNNLEYINLSSFEIKNVINMNRMFKDCKNLERIDLSSFALQKTTRIEEMFFGCDNLREIKTNKNSYDIMITKNYYFEDIIKKVDI